MTATVSHSPRAARFAATPATVWLAVFLLLPLAVMLGRYVTPAEITRVVARDSTWRVVGFSAWLAVLSVVATCIVAAPITWLLARYEFRGRRLLRAMATVGFLLPSVVVGAGFLAVLPRSLHYTMFAVVLAHAYFNIAVIVRIVGARLEMLDHRLAAAARTLGASSRYSFVTITLPLVRTALASAALVVFLYCFSSFAIVRVLGGPSRNTMESDIALRAFGIGDLPAATVLAMLQALLMLCAFIVFRLIGGRAVTVTTTAVPQLPQIPRRLRGWAWCIGLATGCFVAAPLIAVIAKSLLVGGQWTFEAWRMVLEGGVRDSIFASVRTAALAAPIAVVLAGATSLAIVRLRTTGRALDGLSIAPLAISPVTLGLGLVITFDNGWYDWRSEWWFVAIAHTLVAFPLVVRVLVPAWRAIPARLNDAAATLGAGELRRLVDVDLRLVRRAAVGSLGIVIAISVGEFGAASLLTRRGAETMPVVIARLLGRTGDLVRAQAFALATLLIVMCVTALVLVEVALGRRRHAANH